MKDIFTKLRQPDEGTNFTDRLFPSRWWSSDIPKKQVSIVRGEKEDTLRSLNDFVEERQGDEGTAIRFPGGEIAAKPVAPTIEVSSSQLNADQIYQEIESCKLCSQKSGAAQFKPCREVIEVLFVADFPGASEEQIKLLDRMIEAMKITKNKFSKTLAIKCPSSNDIEEEWESMGANCRTHLHKEIAFLKPKVVLTFGAVATRLLLNQDVKLSKVHGKFHPQKVVSVSGESFDFQVVPIFHLDLLMINPNMKKITWTDLQSVMKFLDNL